jgi:hypothetical protein
MATSTAQKNGSRSPKYTVKRILITVEPHPFPVNVVVSQYTGKCTQNPVSVVIVSKSA